jgi:hypothetical protein
MIHVDGDPAAGAARAVLEMLRTICPEADLRLDPDGTVVVQRAGACSPDSPRRSCRCICEAIEFDRTVTIRIDARRARRGRGGLTVDAVEDNTANGVGSDETIYVDSRNTFRAPDWIILGHELCGHALPGMRGNHPEWRPGRPGYDPNWHQRSIDAENVIRGERDLPPR